MAGWSAESWSLVVTGGMLALVVIASTHPRVALNVRSRGVFLAGAAIFVAFAVLAEEVVSVAVPPAVFVFPVVPLAVAVVLVRDAVAAARAGRGPKPARATAGASWDPPAPAPAAVAPFGAEGAGVERLLAASPYATPVELSRLAFSHPELRTAIAANPAAPVSLLEWLADLGEPAILAAISSRRPLAS